MGTPAVEDSADAHPSKAVDVAIAEFNALRAEIANRITVQSTGVGVGLTALGVIFGIVVKDDGDNRLLLAVPPLSTVICLLITRETYLMAKIGAYIRDELWPFLNRKVGEQVGELPSWESRLARGRRSFRETMLAFILDIPAFLLFTAASAVALIVVDPGKQGELRSVGWVLTIITLGLPAVYALIIRSEAGQQEQSAKRTGRD
jgi:hypothetical protein